ncbi:MAG: S8 family serine peptidase, partial [bacterium]
RVRAGFHVNEIINSTQSIPTLKINRAFPHHPNSSELSGIYNLCFDSTIRPEEFAADLSQYGLFEYVEPRYLSFVSETIPNDTLLSHQFYLAQINMFSAWDVQQGSPDIVIAIVDNGTDYQHPDLFENIWTNQAEAQGKPGFDDDGNGYIDDIYGWDFGENDNDPTFGTDEGKIAAHGTHIAGIASAVTNNIAGIAGVGWKCKIMTIKTSEDENTLLIPFGYEGIVYAADNGAQIINNSWGRSGVYSQYEQDIINYAVRKGSIIIGAAGNSNKQTMFYPAGYVHVIAATAVNEADQKASYSNYGKFVDISAPGGDLNNKIFSTFPVERGSYGELSGTSMASPIVAGIMALMINQCPEATLVQLNRQLVLTADNIDVLNPDYQGLLGFGRVDGLGALTEDVQQEEPARIAFFKAIAHDSIWGNGNFMYERNETIGIDTWYRNFAISPGRNFVLTLSTEDNDLVVTKNRATINYVPPDSIFSIGRQLKFFIKPDAEPHSTRLVLNYSLDNGAGGSDTLFSIIGKSSVLLVDDDNGSRNVEKYYTTILDHLGVPYLPWDHFRLGTPPPETLTHFPTVIWFCEWASPGLEPDDRIALQYYLNQKGRLFISGQDIGWDLADPASDSYSESTVQFYREYLHSEYKDDDSRASEVVGIPGTIAQGMQFDIFQPGISAHSQFPEWIEPTDDASSCFCYDNDKGAGIIYDNAYKVLNLGFGFEAVDSSPLKDPFRISRHKLELMKRILNKLGPLIHTPVNDMEKAGNPISFRVELSPLINDLQSLSLFWKTDTMSTFSTITMDSIGNHVFQQVINLESYIGKVSYYFRMTTSYYQFSLPVIAENKPYSFFIGMDRIPPEFYHIPLKDIFIQNIDRNIGVFVEDNVAVDTNSVWLHYKTTNM